MTAETIITISAAVVALVQLVKWMGLPDGWGPGVVLLVSALGVVVWLLGAPTWPPSRTDVWPIFVGWISVAANAAGIYGFTRAAASTVTRLTPAPPLAPTPKP